MEADFSLDRVLVAGLSLTGFIFMRYTHLPYLLDFSIVEARYRNTIGTEISYSYSVLILTTSVIYYPGIVPKTGRSYSYSELVL